MRGTIRLGLLALGTMVALGGCDIRRLLGIVLPGSMPIDLIAPAIVSTNPADGDIFVSAGATISVTFTESVDSASLTSASFSVRDADGNAVSGTLSASQVATFTPDGNLSYSSEYTVTVTAGITDMAGNPLAAGSTWTFTTAPVPVSGGGWHTLAIKQDGTVWAWGANFSGGLGDGTSTSSLTPLQVRGEGGMGFLGGVVAVAAGNEHSLAITEDGYVWAWGSNGDGELGDGTTDYRTTPVRVVGPGGVGYLTGVIAVAADYYQSLALKSDGTVWGWGDNSYDQLGDGTGTSTSVPVQVKGPGGSGFLTGVVGISAGAFHSLAVKSDGTVWAWGWGPYGELGDGALGSRSTPTQVILAGGGGALSGVVAVDAGEYVSAALKADGTVWTWGGNYAGQLGNGSTVDSNAAVQVVAPEGQTGFLANVVQIEAAYDHMVARLSDGTVWSWGSNLFGELGIGTTADSSRPVQAKGVDGVGLLSGVVGITTTDYYTTFALLSNGTLVGWGWNDDNELGTTTDEVTGGGRYYRSTPLPIGSLDLDG